MFKTNVHFMCNSNTSIFDLGLQRSSEYSYSLFPINTPFGKNVLISQMYIILKHTFMEHQALLSTNIKDNLIPRDMTRLKAWRRRKRVLWWDGTNTDRDCCPSQEEKRGVIGQSVSCHMSHVTVCWWRRMPAVSLCIFWERKEEIERKR